MNTFTRLGQFKSVLSLVLHYSTLYFFVALEGVFGKIVIGFYVKEHAHFGLLLL